MKQTANYRNVSHVIAFRAAELTMDYTGGWCWFIKVQIVAFE